MDLMKVDPEGRRLILFTKEGDEVTAHLVQDGQVVESRVVGYTQQWPPLVDLRLVMAAGVKAILATVAVMALLYGYPEVALLALSVLRMLSH